MKIIFLSDANSIHTFRWVESLKLNNFDILLFSFFEPNQLFKDRYKKLKINIVSPALKIKSANLRKPKISKIKYLFSLPLLKKTLKNYNPDILHAHYASSYGLMGLLCGFRPFILSAWGSDIYHFPYTTFLNKVIMKMIIKNADIVCSTSNAMKKMIIDDYQRNDINVIPFGIDLKQFKPSKIKNEDFVIGTIKSIENYNGIDCLIDAVNIIIHDYRINLSVSIVGDGSLRNSMEQRAKDLNIFEHVKFHGHVDHNYIKSFYDELSVFIAVSTRESFGVSVLEAAACQIPSITSNIGGLIEVNKDNVTGKVINANDPNQLADSIVNLMMNVDLRNKMGKAARKRVSEKFNFAENSKQMISIYKKFK